MLLPSYEGNIGAVTSWTQAVAFARLRNLERFLNLARNGKRAR